VPNYELPSNIPGLTFTNPLNSAQQLSNLLRPTNDVVVALTHIGFTQNPASVEVDDNVDTVMAALVSGLDAIIGAHSHTNPATGFGNYKYLPTIVGGPANIPVLINQAYRYNNTLGEVVIGVRPKAGGGYEVVSRAGQYISVVMATPEDPAITAIVAPYVTALNAYNNKVVGQTTAPIDTMLAFTQETNGANLQADSAVYELAKNGITVDFHLSGAMTNKLIAVGATPATPYTLKISDMFAAMPYENSLVVLNMNGPQLKAVLERAYRNYYYYKYVPGYGGYSYYTTCMIDINSVGKITYNDLYPAAYDPLKSYVVSLVVNGTEVDFANASKYYKVSTVNYLAAGSCNFNDNGLSLWPLNQIANDTQYYVRDAVIDYVTFKGIVSPAIEGRLNFIYDVTAPTITINTPQPTTYLHPNFLTLDFGATDALSGVGRVQGYIDCTPVTNGQVFDLYTLLLGDHTLTVYARDKAYNLAAPKTVKFTVAATIDSLITGVNRFYSEGKISSAVTYRSLMDKLQAAKRATSQTARFQYLNAFITQVNSQKGITITAGAADLLMSDAQCVKGFCPRRVPPCTPPAPAPGW
jgi:2',3'-cyclic-nucleotide 2'-phosphodiesterase (5'-nucleotidase family)